MNEASTQRLFIACAIAALLAPSFVWATLDQHAWPWDPAHYAAAATWLRNELFIENRLSALLHTTPGRAPLLPWFAQFFVPLRHLTGSVETSLLTANITLACGTLVLVYLTTRRMGARIMEAAVAVLLCGGAGGFIALTNQFLTELAQAFSAALMMFACFRVEHRSWARSLAIVVIAAAIALLAKTSSVLFIAPLLFYCAVALAFSGASRPAPSGADKYWLAVAVALLAITVVWYAVNWEPMSAHLKEATGEGALPYGSRPVLSAKLILWEQTISSAISAYTPISVSIVLLIIAGFALSIQRTVRLPPGVWLRASINSGLLFALTLALTRMAIVGVYCFSINEDRRFILMLVPMIAVLTGWALSAISLPVLTSAAIVLLVGNAAVNHAHALRIIDAPSFIYLLRFDDSALDRRRLDRVAEVTCHGERWNVIAVAYPAMNSESANFHAQKRRLGRRDARCRYANLGALGDVAATMSMIRQLSPAFVITIAPEAQVKPPDRLNVLSLRVTEGLAGEPNLRLLERSQDGLIIYKDVP
jgi:hypothetical protein